MSSSLETMNHSSQTSGVFSEPQRPHSTVTPNDTHTASGQSTPLTMDAAPKSELAPSLAATASRSLAEPKHVWYLGGNHAIKLLTSVNGDFDDFILSNLAAVPQVIGELALSVEALVSEDLTVGGFENDLLAKIASNTLVAKRASQTNLDPVAPVSPTPDEKTPVVEEKPDTDSQVSPIPVNPIMSATSGTAPAPVANYEPVPNPLARITPPRIPHFEEKRTRRLSLSLGEKAQDGGSYCSHLNPDVSTRSIIHKFITIFCLRHERGLLAHDPEGHALTQVLV